MTELRPARPEETERLRDICRATYFGTMAAIVPPAALKAFEEVDEAGRFVEACWQDFDVAVAGGEIAGFLFVHENKIESLHIHPDHARKGYGAALLTLGEEKIAAKFDHAELDVLVGNDNALNFYISHGWEEVRRFEGLEVGDTPAPMILMRKGLARRDQRFIRIRMVCG